MDQTPKGRAAKRGAPDLSYFVRSLEKRFPEKTTADIEEALRSALEAIAPSRDRTKLRRLIIRMLKDELPSNGGGNL